MKSKDIEAVLNESKANHQNLKQKVKEINVQIVLEKSKIRALKADYLKAKRAEKKNRSK